MQNGVMQLDRILSGRKLRRLGPQVELLETTTSTNDHVWRRAEDDPADGYVVFAEYQSAGRGRFNRPWVSPRGASVMVSVLLIDSADHPTPPVETLGLLAGIATSEAIHSAVGIDAQIAWPNDIVVHGRKLAGVLIESRTLPSELRAFAVGIGINCLQHRDHFPPELRSRATSLELESNQPVDRETVAGALLAALDEWLADSSRWEPDVIKTAFVQHALPFGRHIRLQHEGRSYEGQVVDLDPSAALVVQLDEGGRMLFPTAGTTVDADDPPLR